MNNTPLISVIVPVYNVEKYLDQCIESIVNQTYKNLEIILVDDGSPDNCPAICDEWAKKDSRIKVIHKRNGGGGEARNFGLDISQGEFIGMVDSDDYISPFMYEHLYSLINEDVDISECEILITDNDNAKLDSNISNNTARLYTTSEAMKLHIQDALFRQTPPNKLYRNNVLQNVRFPLGTQIDDEFWTYKTIANARSLCHSNLKLYAYRQQISSVMHRAFSLGRLTAIEAKCQRLNLIEEKFPDLYYDAINNLYFTCRYLLQLSMKELSKEDFKTASESIKKVFNNKIRKNLKLSQLSIKEKIWFICSKISFCATCRIRNFLKLGI